MLLNLFSPPSFSFTLSPPRGHLSLSSSLRHVADTNPDGHVAASAVAQAIRVAATSPVEFVQRVEKINSNGKNGNSVLPSSDFNTLCLEQLELFRRIVHPKAVLSKETNPDGHVAASAVAQAIRVAATSPVEFLQRVEINNSNNGKNGNKGFVLPSSDFNTLCLEQLELFRRIVHPNAVLSKETNPDGHVAASAVAQAIRVAATSPVEFMQRVEINNSNNGKDGNKGFVLPSSDFNTLCLEQLEMFRRIVHPNAVLSVFVRPAGSYVMDRLELRRVAVYPGVNSSEIVILTGTFSVPTGLRAAESAISNQEAEVISECRAVVFPMVKKPFVVGFLVAELPHTEFKTENYDIQPFPMVDSSLPLPPYKGTRSWRIQLPKDKQFETYEFTDEQRLNAINISRSLAMAYVMDQKMLLLQQSSWQNNVRMSSLVEQIRGPLSSIRTLSKMLSLHLKRSEISYDIAEDILVQGDQMRDTLQQLQDAVYVTKANIMQYNEDSLRKNHLSFYHAESPQSQISSNMSSRKDLEMPMPPLTLAPLQQQNIRRPCNVSDVLSDLVEAVKLLAHKQQRGVELCELSRSLPVAVEEPALRQALSNLIEGALLRTHVGGKVEIMTAEAPAGGALVLIDDDGPDMQYMTQMHSLTPFGTDLLSEEMVEDNMTWNFIAGLTVAREILESYGCVVRVISPRIADTAPGAGGTRIELWLPSSAAVDEA